MQITSNIGKYVSFVGLYLIVTASGFGQEKQESSYSPVIEESFDTVLARDKARKAMVMKRHTDLLNQRYDLTKRVAADARMSGGKPVPVGPTARLSAGLT